MRRTILITCLTFLISSSLGAQNRPNLVPLPVWVAQKEGFFVMGKEVCILISPEARETSHYLASKLRAATGYSVTITETSQPEAEKRIGDIVLHISPQLGEITSKEGYILSVDSANVIISATAEAGLFYGVQTLLQLLPPIIYSGAATGWESWKIPALSIKDYPRFGYRGFMLDVSRQFYDIASVKKHLDWMAMHKFNVFHWHLTDDNGWRIEVKKYPKLTQIGAWRGPNEVLPPSYGSGNKRYGGFYTQEEIKEIVAYAQKLHINIIPEIDLPGHAKSAIASYPEVFCKSKDASVSVNGENRNLWCVSREANYKMLDDIIAQIARLFPWEYIHIGGDEVNPAPWKECPHCQALMAQEKMENIMDLQTHFVKRMELIVEKHGKKMMGWDEMIDRGVLSPKTAVMAWRGLPQGKSAMQKGHPTVMHPAAYTYLAMKSTADERGHSWAGLIDMDQVYAYDPVGTAGLSPSEASLLLGVEASIWSELMDRPVHYTEYQTYPRLCAVAELAWTPQELRVWDDFNLRMGLSHFDRLYEMGIAFRVPPPKIEYTGGMLVISPPYPWSIVRYTSNELTPDLHAPVYHRPIVTNEPWKYRFVSSYRDKYISHPVAGAPKVYKTPVTTVEASFGLRPRFLLKYLTDYEPETYIRSMGPLKVGDYLIYRFIEPLDCEQLTINTGIPGVPIHYMEAGYAAYSMDGENFVKAGDLVYGTLTFNPPKGIKALKIIAEEGNYSLQTSFLDLQIE